MATTEKTVESESLSDDKRRRKDLYFSPENFKLIEETVPEGVPLATFMQNTVLEKIRNLSKSPVRSYAPIPVLGYIPGGPALEVVPMPDHTTATPPFSVDPDCYALLVVGDSMEAQVGPSIPSGSYAVFCADATPFYGTFVHVEWEDTPGVRLCTIKRFEPQPDGSAIFSPLNKTHKPITRAKDKFQVRGVFMRSWKEG